MFPVEHVGGVAVVSVSAEMDARNAGRAKDFFKQLIAGGGSKVVIDLSPVTFIDSSGLGALLTALKASREAGGDTRLCGMSAAVKTIFELTRMYRVFDIFPGREEALKSFQ